MEPTSLTYSEASKIGNDIEEGKPCRACGAEFEPDISRHGHQTMTHEDDCAYMHFIHVED